MATKKQSFEQPKETGASKTAPGSKQSGSESSTSSGQSTSANQGAQSNQGATGQGTTGQAATGQGAKGQGTTGQGATGQGATGQGQTGQSKPTGQGSTGQGQGATGQGATGQGASGQGKTGQNTATGQGASAQGSSGQNKGGEQDLLQHAKHATGEIVSQVQQQAGSQLARQKDSAADDLTQVVQAVRRFGESLTGQEQGGPIARYAAEYGDKAAASLERFSTYIREQDPKQLLNDVQNFGRRQPALLLGGAFLLGLAGARLIKSSMSMGSTGTSHQSYRPNSPAMRPPTNPNAM